MYLGIDVRHAPIDERLLGRSIDAPRAGSQAETAEIAVEGWVHGRESKVLYVEVWHDNHPIRRILLGALRPDVAQHFNLPEAAASGFRAVIPVSNFVAARLDFFAVLRDRSRISIGTIESTPRGAQSKDPSEASLVSVIIPSWGQSHFLSDCIESILAQTHPLVEIIVVDDGSWDNTSQVALRYPGVRLIRQTNQGLAASRNNGFAASNGDFIIFLDCDDRLLPTAAAVGVRKLLENPRAAFASGAFRHVSVDGMVCAEATFPPQHPNCYEGLLGGNSLGLQASMFRRAALTRVGLFDRSFAACEDYELFLRCARVFPAVVHDELVADYRHHGGSMSMNASKMLKTGLQVIKKQRRYVRSDPALRKALRAGLDYHRSYYGPSLAEEIYLEREVRFPWRKLSLLMREYPEALRIALARRI